MICLPWVSTDFLFCRGMERTYEAPSNEAPHMILGYHQGRLVTYLLHLCLWRPAKPRTGVSNFMFAATISFYFGSNRNHRSIFSTGTIARQFSQEIPVRLPQSAVYFLQFSSTISQNWESHWLSQVAELFICILERWYLILTGDMNICRMSIEHQLLTLFFHWTLDGLGFWFWGRCHDRCIPQQNSRSCFSSSVWLMSSRQDDMSPMREPFGKELNLQSTLNLHFYS